ncbi:MAG: helix-hairpin-helix domain-containing protein [Methanobacterium sp.]
MTVTSKGTMWEIINSWWILLTLPFGFSSWVAFLYIGLTAKERKWILWGAVYSLTFVMNMVIGSDPKLEYFILVPENSWVITLRDCTLFILWPVSIIHAFYIRNDYLRKLESVKRLKTDSNDEYLKKKYEMEYYYGDKEKNYIKLGNPFKKFLKGEDTSKQVNVKPSKLVDINKDPEEEIAELPGIGIILAKKVIEIRQSNPFKSVDELGEALGLKPHMIERIKPLIVINTRFQKEDENQLESLESGRMVDY